MRSVLLAFVDAPFSGNLRKKKKRKKEGEEKLDKYALTCAYTEKEKGVPLRLSSMIRKMSQKRNTHAYTQPESRLLAHTQHDAA